MRKITTLREEKFLRCWWRGEEGGGGRDRERELRPFPTLFFSPSIRSPFSPLLAQSLSPPPDTVPTIRIFFSRHQTRSTIVFHKFQPDHDPTNTLSHLFRGYVFSGKRKARHRCWWFPPTRPRVSRSIVSTYSRQRTNQPPYDLVLPSDCFLRSYSPECDSLFSFFLFFFFFNLFDGKVRSRSNLDRV